MSLVNYGIDSHNKELIEGTLATFSTIKVGQDVVADKE
jgi:hypothetical protein